MVSGWCCFQRSFWFLVITVSQSVWSAGFWGILRPDEVGERYGLCGDGLIGGSLVFGEEDGDMSVGSGEDLKSGSGLYSRR